MAKSKTMTRRKASPKPIHQPGGVPRLSVMALILSVTEAYVYPGSRTGVGVGSTCSFWMGGVSSLMVQSSSLPLAPEEGVLRTAIDPAKLAGVLRTANELYTVPHQTGGGR